ncbi:MAG: tellurite resistance TerB family protein [Pseudomonadota bacterium]
MSLVKTLAKVAIGMAVAKGVSGMMKGGNASAGRGTDGLFGGTNLPQSAGTGGIQDVLGTLMGGAGSAQGGLGGLLDGLSQSSRPGAATGAGQAGGLQDIIGGLAGQLGQGGGAPGGGLGGLLGGLAGALQGGAGSSGDGQSSFGDVFNSSFDQTPQAQIDPTPDQEAAAALMLSAMIQAAKSDGKFDAQEQEKLLAQLDEVTTDERALVQAEMQKPVDADALARNVPNGMEPQVYAMSLMGIDLDNQNEAQYLHQLAQALQLDASTVNNIHDQLGAPKLYS